MADITLPQLGETVTEGTITRWFKKVGDTIAADEPLFEVSTDKVDTEVPSPVAGTVTEIRVAEGETVAVGTVIAVVGAAGAAPAPAPVAAAPAPVAAPAPAPVVAAPAPAPAPSSALSFSASASPPNGDRAGSSRGGRTPPKGGRMPADAVLTPPGNIGCSVTEVRLPPPPMGARS